MFITKSDMLIALRLKHCVISEQNIVAEGDCISAGLCELAHRYLHTRAATVEQGHSVSLCKNRTPCSEVTVKLQWYSHYVVLRWCFIFSHTFIHLFIVFLT